MPNLCFSTRQIKGLFIITHYYCSANVMNDVRLHGLAVLCTVLHAVAAVVTFHSSLQLSEKVSDDETDDDDESEFPVIDIRSSGQAQEQG